MAASMQRRHNANPEHRLPHKKPFPSHSTGDFRMNASRLILVLAAAFAASGTALACDDPATGHGQDASAAQHQTSAQLQSGTQAAN
jgi:hypothetical protein